MIESKQSWRITKAAALLGFGIFTSATTSQSAWADEDTPDFRVEAGGFYAGFTGGYGRWGGSQARFWLLDVEGTRGYSGYINIIDLHWSPEQPESLHSSFFMGRAMYYWSDHIYTLTTLGGTADEPIFPRLQAETEVNLALPQHPVLVFTVGAGDRYYAADLNRPYLVLGASYSLAHAAVLYRYWLSAELSTEASHTHLFTLVYGERLKYWLRADFLWGAEASNTGLQLLATDVQSRGIEFTLEKWITDDFGILTSASVTELFILQQVGTAAQQQQNRFHRWQLTLRPFVTF